MTAGMSHQQGGHAAGGEAEGNQAPGGMHGASHAGHELAPAAETDASAASPATRPNAAVAKPVYVCPMHKQVRSDKPGKCPICKMNLKPTPMPAEAAPAGKPASNPSTQQDVNADHAHHEKGGNK